MTWLTNAYHYIYFRTYYVISKTNKTSAESSASRLLSVSILLNCMSIYFFLKSPFDEKGLYFFLSAGVLLSFLNFKYFMNDKRRNAIIESFETLEIASFFKYIVDIYPWLSILVVLISTGASFNTVLICIGILFVLRLMQFFYEM